MFFPQLTAARPTTVVAVIARVVVLQFHSPRRSRSAPSAVSLLQLTERLNRFSLSCEPVSTVIRGGPSQEVGKFFQSLVHFFLPIGKGRVVALLDEPQD